MDHIALRNEIMNDPAGLGYVGHVQSGADNRIADLLNQPAGQRYVPLSIGEVLIWAAQTGAMRKLSAGTQHPEQAIATVAETALALINAPLETIDIGRAEVRGMLDALVTGGVLTVSDANSLLERASRMSSRANDLGFGSVSDQDVAVALRG